MFDQSVSSVVLVAVVLAIVASMVISLLLAQRLARPLADVGRAARRLASGDLSARVPREGPEEIRDLADSFNQMAAALDQQEQIRRDFIANAAHELRTPLTNLQGYLEALRDGVIQADAATYDSLWEEADRLVRLSRSLDALAEGDTPDHPPRLQEVDLSAAVHTAVDIIQPQIERAGLTLTVDVPDHAVPLPGRVQPGRQLGDHRVLLRISDHARRPPPELVTPDDDYDADATQVVRMPR